MIMDSSKLPKYKDVPMRKEDVIIKRIEEERPKFIIKLIVNRYNYSPPPDELSIYSIGPKAEKYIDDNYSLAKKFPFSNNEEEIRVYKRRGTFQIAQ